MQNGDHIKAFADYSAIFNIFLYLAAVALSWWGLQEFRFDVLLKRPKSAQAKLLQIFLSLALGYLVASFFIQYLGWSIGLNRII